MKNYLYYLIFAASVILIALAAMIATNSESTVEDAPLRNNPLKVINGSQMYTNVEGGSLQQASPPANSATSSDLSPQKASPNYCTSGEVPYADGCVPY